MIVHWQLSPAGRSELAKCPAHLVAGLLCYLQNRVEPGGFLMAVLANDLADAVLRADPVSAAALPALVRWLHAHAPAHAWGSPSARTAWLSAPKETE